MPMREWKKWSGENKKTNKQKNPPKYWLFWQIAAMLVWCCVWWWHWCDSSVLKCPSYPLTLPGVVTWIWWDRWRGSVCVWGARQVYTLDPLNQHTPPTHFPCCPPWGFRYLCKSCSWLSSSLSLSLHTEGPELYCGESFLPRYGSRVCAQWTLHEPDEILKVQMGLSGWCKQLTTRHDPMPRDHSLLPCSSLHRSNAPLCPRAGQPLAAYMLPKASKSYHFQRAMKQEQCFSKLKVHPRPFMLDSAELFYFSSFSKIRLLQVLHIE